jgi:hypothetical membrane protein
MSDITKRNWGAITTVGGVMLFIVTVATLHILQPTYDSRHQLMSELALGQYGWAMFYAFLGLAAAIFGVQSAIGVYQATRSYRILLSVAATLFLLAGVYPLGNTSMVHITVIAVAFVLSVLAMYLFPFSAGRASSVAPRSLSWTLAAGVALSVVLGHVIPIGIGQRLAAGCLLLWLLTVAWKLLRR